MNLITLTSADGHQRSCNATCHNAKGMKCRCICGGLLHGASTPQALKRRIEEKQSRVIATTLRLMNREDVQVEIDTILLQRALF